MPVTTTLPWDVLAALPETYLTAQGVAGRAWDRAGRPGAAADPGRDVVGGDGRRVDRVRPRVETAATTRRPDKVDALTAAGVDHALVDDGGSLAASVHALWPEGPDYVLDLVGASTAVDSLHLVRAAGRSAWRARSAAG